jgi:hypothetical protein
LFFRLPQLHSSGRQESMTKFVKAAKAQGRQLTFFAWEDWPRAVQSA